MTRTWVVGLGFGLCLSAAMAAAGCSAEGDDDDTPRAGTGGGAGRGGSLRATLQQSVECQIAAAGLGVMASDCEGIEEFTSCLESMCGLADCESSCNEYATC